jgi:peptide-methionine (S)-S-oxide reductase
MSDGLLALGKSIFCSPIDINMRQIGNFVGDTDTVGWHCFHSQRLVSIAWASGQQDDPVRLIGQEGGFLSAPIALSMPGRLEPTGPTTIFGSRPISGSWGPHCSLSRSRRSDMGTMTERAVLAGGCFWGMQDLIRKLRGVISTRVGYTGGDVRNATYRNHGTHAEAIEIIFDPQLTSFRELLEFFFQIHDPTTLNRQGNDIGLSYRSAIFYTTPEQEKIARDTIADVEASDLWPGRVTTELAAVGDFWEAEPEHQDYLERYPDGYTCHFVRPGWRLPKRKAS